MFRKKHTADSIALLSAGCFASAALDPHRREWRGFIQWACILGQAATVVAFNRLPTLNTAAAQRIFAGIVASCFYDNMAVDMEALGGAVQFSVPTIYRSQGVRLAPSKHVGLGRKRIALGNYFDVADYPEAGLVHQDVSESFKTKLLSCTDGVLTRRECFPGTSGKKRGCLTWASSRARGWVGGLLLQERLSRLQYCVASPIVGEDSRRAL